MYIIIPMLNIKLVVKLLSQSYIVGDTIFLKGDTLFFKGIRNIARGYKILQGDTKYCKPPCKILYPHTLFEGYTISCYTGNQRLIVYKSWFQTQILFHIYKQWYTLYDLAHLVLLSAWCVLVHWLVFNIYGAATFSNSVVVNLSANWSQKLICFLRAGKWWKSGC